LAHASMASSRLARFSGGETHHEIAGLVDFRKT